MTEDDKVFYPLATDSEDETEEWLSVLTRAIGLEVEETDRVPGVCVCVCVCVATDSEDETEEWLSVLTRAIGLEVEETDRVPGVCVCVCVCVCWPPTVRTRLRNGSLSSPEPLGWRWRRRTGCQVCVCVCVCGHRQ